MSIDVLFVNPANHVTVYQDLANDFSAIEPPTWALLLAESVRSIGFSPAILDVNAERLSNSEAAKRITTINARLVCFVVYGQNPNSGTVNMTGASELAGLLKTTRSETKICVVGSHVSALPIQVLKTELAFDFVLCNEGVYALRNLLALDFTDPNCLAKVQGIGYRVDGKPVLTNPERVVPQEQMDIDLPGYAWDLLPYKRTPLDLYRAHFWHAEYDHSKRSPFAAIYTSLGCTFRCNFCMINILNRDNNEEIGVASDYSKMRFWSPTWVIREFDNLVKMGVRNVRISDEMFLLNKKYFVPLCEMLRDRGYGNQLSMWAYSRIDTVCSSAQLKLIRDAGIRWLALGIESADKKIRLEVTKGKFQNVDIQKVIQTIHDSDIEVIANYLFGLPGDTMETMQETLDLSMELCTVAWNGYPVMALPGSAIYKMASENGYDLPTDYNGYAFHSYDTLPLPTDKLSPAQILAFRDRAFVTYHRHKPFLDKVAARYGDVAVQNIQEMTKIRLKRKILEQVN